MQNLRTLVENVQQAKIEYHKLQDEKETTVDMARYDELKGLIADQTNVVYNATRALSKMLYAELGVYPRELGDLVTCYGYVVGKNVRVQPVED